MNFYRIFCTCILLTTLSIGYANEHTTFSPMVVNLPKHYQTLAPDGSQVRLLVRNTKASMAEFTLTPEAISRAIHQKVVHEFWYFLSGTGQVWVKYKGKAKIYSVHTGTSLALPNNVYFQFKNTSKKNNLAFVDVVIPPWPKKVVTTYTKGPWKSTQHAANP